MFKEILLPIDLEETDLTLRSDRYRAGPGRPLWRPNHCGHRDP